MTEKPNATLTKPGLLLDNSSQEPHILSPLERCKGGGNHKDSTGRGGSEEGSGWCGEAIADNKRAQKISQWLENR